MTTVAGWRPPPVGDGLHIGQSVRHASFGVGVIVASEGAGPQARVQVNFASAGMKWLLLEYARLIPV
jgi:DNA helicase-2/ATP-dependent DNA helicase PcrA